MGDLPHITEAEWEVMRAVWDRGDVSARQVVEAVADGKDWSDRTVKALLGRLVKKGVLDYEVDGPRYIYRARISRETCLRAESESMLAKARGGPVSPLLAHFVKQAQLSAEEIEELRRLLSEKEDGR